MLWRSLKASPKTRSTRFRSAKAVRPNRVDSDAMLARRSRRLLDGDHRERTEEPGARKTSSFRSPLTASRVFIEQWGNMVLPDGRPYRNKYVFRFSIRQGRISHVREYFNPVIARLRIQAKDRQFLPGRGALNDRPARDGNDAWRKVS